MPFFTSFSELPPRTAASSGDSPNGLFSSREWYENYVDTVVGDRHGITLVAAVEPASDRSANVLPMIATPRAHPFAMRRIESLSNFYSSEFDFLGGSRGDSAALDAASVAAELDRSRPRWDCVNVKPIASTSEWIGSFDVALRSRGWLSQKYHCFTNLYLRNEYQDFAAFLKTRSSRIRKTAANRTRKFDRGEHNEFRLITAGSDIAAGLDLFDHLYEKRWGRTEPYPKFLPGLAALCADKGWLRLGLLTVNKVPAAAQFWIVRNKTAYIFKVAYDEAFTNLSVGAVALFKMFEYVMDVDKVEVIDFLTGDEGYKRDWMDESREMVGLVAYNLRTAKGLTSGVTNQVGSLMKGLFRKRE